MAIGRRKFLQGTSAGLASLAAPRSPGRNWGPSTLSLISESGANSVDPHTPGANRGAYEVAWNCYDRLLSLKIEKDENGADHANANKPAPELAEEWNDNGHSRHLQAAQGRDLPRRRAGHGQGRQMVARPRHRRPAAIRNSSSALDRITDPAAIRRRRRPYVPHRLCPLRPPDAAEPRVLHAQYSQFRADQEARHGEPIRGGWTGRRTTLPAAAPIRSSTARRMRSATCASTTGNPGPLPKMERVVWRVVPSAATRRALLERGDVDVSNEFPPNDIVEMKREGKVNVYRHADRQCRAVHRHERENAAIRQRQRAARHRLRDPVPEDHGRRALQRGAPAVRRDRQISQQAKWPQPSPYNTDLAKAKALLAAGGAAPTASKRLFHSTPAPPTFSSR